jgi:hypothetical protein
MSSLRSNRSAIALALLISLPGCAFSTAHVNPTYTPETGKKTPLSTITPMTISLEVEDQRAPGERDRVGDKKNNFGSVTAKVIPDQDPTTVIYDALKAEFENNSHTVIKKDDGQSDALVTIVLRKYWSDFAIHFFDVEMKGTMDTDIAITKDKDELAAKPLNATYRESRQMVLDSAFESALRGVLSEYIRSFARDPNLIEALRAVSIQKEKVKGL